MRTGVISGVLILCVICIALGFLLFRWLEINAAQVTRYPLTFTADRTRAGEIIIEVYHGPWNIPLGDDSMVQLPNYYAELNENRILLQLPYDESVDSCLVPHNPSAPPLCVFVAYFHLNSLDTGVYDVVLAGPSPFSTDDNSLQVTLRVEPESVSLEYGLR